MKICVLTSGHDVFDNRIYYKEILSLRKTYKQIYLVAPGEKDFVTDEGIIVKCFPKRKAWYDRIKPMKNMYSIAEKINADVYHAHEPDSFQVAVKLKKNLKSKIIYDSHEYHPEGFAEHFPYCKKLITKIIYLYEKKLGKNADYIISVNDILVNKFKTYNKNVALIPNYPVLSKMNDKILGEKPTFIYVGGLREDRGILKILQAISKVKNDCKYYFVGPFETKEFEKQARLYCENNLAQKDVTFTGKIPHVKVFDYLRKSHAGFVLLQPTNWRYINSEPIKLFEYMMSKTAVIASNFPMMKNIISKSNSGILVEPDNIDEICLCIENISNDINYAKMLGENGLKAVEKNYNWKVCEERLLNLYKDLQEK